MAVFRGAAREAQAEHAALERRTEITTSQLGVHKGYTLNPEIAEVVKKLLGYLQLVVTLMATMVPPTKESKMREKRGQEALAQATSMVLTVSIFVH